MIFSTYSAKSDKFRAQMGKTIDRGKLLDDGKIKLGSQRDGYHEYILEGDLHEGKLHFRVVPIAGELQWIAWTGYKQDPTDPTSDEGLWDIEQDRHKNITYIE